MIMMLVPMITVLLHLVVIMKMYIVMIITNVPLIIAIIQWAVIMILLYLVTIITNVPTILALHLLVASIRPSIAMIIINAPMIAAIHILDVLMNL